MPICSMILSYLITLPGCFFFLPQSQHYHLLAFSLPLWFEAVHQNTNVYGKRGAPEGHITHSAEHFQFSVLQRSVYWLRLFAIWGTNVCCLKDCRTVNHTSFHWFWVCWFSEDLKNYILIVCCNELFYTSIYFLWEVILYINCIVTTETEKGNTKQSMCFE